MTVSVQIIFETEYGQISKKLSHACQYPPVERVAQEYQDAIDQMKNLKVEHEKIVKELIEETK